MTVTSTKRKASTVKLDESSTTGPSCTDRRLDVDFSGIRYSCDFCFKDISAIVRIQCAECGLLPHSSGAAVSEKTAKTPATSSTLEEVDLCVECFAAGVEFAGHSKMHAYRILKPLDFAVYREDWRADEEMLLLEAIESNGLGNWQDVSEQLGTRTAEECRQQYMHVYLSPAPPSNAPQPDTKPHPPQALPLKVIQQSRETLRRPQSKRPRLSTSEEAVSAAPTPQSVPANHEIAGFMPLRGEFETEVENEAENSIKDLQFLDDDSPAERELKYSMLDIYTSVLERRAARRAFIFSHGLCEFRRHQSVDKSRSREERDIYNILKPFARFLTAEDFQKLLEGLAREEELRRQIAHLQDLRRHGIRSFEEVPSFETEKKHLELYLKGGSAVVPSQQAPRIVAPIREPFPLPVLASAKSPASSPPSNTASTATTTATTTATPTPSLNFSPLAADTTISIPRSTAPSYEPVASSTPVTGATNGNGAFSFADALGSGTVSVGPASSGGRKASTPLNISHAEGVEMLSEKERHLCSILRLYPRLYLSIKDTLIREYLKLGGLKRAQARAAVKIDVNKTSKLYDFFIAAGWIKPPASGE